MVQVNVVHAIVELRWNVSPRNVLTKKKPIKKNDSSANAWLKYAIINTPADWISWSGMVMP